MMNLPEWIEPRLGPYQLTEEEENQRAKELSSLIAELTRRFNHMDRVRAKFIVSDIFTDKNNNSLVNLYAVHKGDESSPENESFSNATPNGSVVLYITNPAAIEFFERLADKYVYLDFTEAAAS